MELYKLVATVENTSDTFEFDFTPENFQGVKIQQSFSFVNPIGYTPKFSVETMKIVLNDKARIDNVFLTYGLESKVYILIKKLDPNGRTYSNVQNFSFAIDFESYEIFDYYSEFSLKSNSSLDYYNRIKNSEINVALPEQISLPTTQKYINYISLKKKGQTRLSPDPMYVFQFEQNNESKFYDKDSALASWYFSGAAGGWVENAEVLQIGQSGIYALNFSYSGSIFVDIAYMHSASYEIAIYSDVSARLFTIAGGIVSNHDGTNPVKITIENTRFDLSERSFTGTDNFFIGIKFDNYDNISSVDGDFFIDIKKDTHLPILSGSPYILAANAEDIIDQIFGGRSTAIMPQIKISPANAIMGLSTKMAIKPTDFINDFCLAVGVVVNFKTDGDAYFYYINTFFDHLFSVENAIAISDVEDLSIKYSKDVSFATVTAGMSSQTYDIYSYFIDWNKNLTFIQDNRNSSENLSLSLTKLRADFSGILDYYYKKSQQSQDSSKDIFIFKEFTDRGNNIYDNFTPRDMLINWTKFLSFCFQNFSKDTLKINSDGGTPDNLLINGVHQMDDLTLAENPRILPIEYNFTCLIDGVDFSEHILKINHDGVDVYLFVIEATTTDNLSEQQIRALKIEF